MGTLAGSGTSSGTAPPGAPEGEPRDPAARTSHAPPDSLRIGVLSDTHGLLRPEARQFLQGCDSIIHGGDIGHPDILETLSGMAPLTVVRGNNDTQEWARRIPATDLMRIGALHFYVIHDLSKLDIEPKGKGVRVVISGHSHKPCVVERDGVLYVNPGSCGPRRFNLPISVAEIVVSSEAVSARIVELQPLRD